MTSVPSSIPENNQVVPPRGDASLTQTCLDTLQSTTEMIGELIGGIDGLEERMNVIPGLVQQVQELSDQIRGHTTSVPEPQSSLPTGLKVQAYEFVSNEKVWTTWILIEVTEDDDREIRAFELNGEFMLRRSPEFLGISSSLENETPEREWLIYHDAIMRCSGSLYPRPRFLSCRLSDMHKIEPNSLTCACLPSFKGLEEHDNAGICHIRLTAQRALLKFNHLLQMCPLGSVVSLKW